MKLIHCVIYIFVFIYILNDIISGDIHSFIFRLPSAVGATLSNAWSDIIKILKTPMRLRKKRKKNKTKSSTTMATPTIPLTYEINYETNISTDFKVKPIIPVFYHPELTVFDWRTLQKPSLVQLIEKIREMKVSTKLYEMNSYRGPIFKKQRLSEENDENKYGVLFFI